MAHDLTKANAAMEKALEYVNAAFAGHGLPPSAVVVNVVYTDGDVEWATGSTVPEIGDADTRRMLINSLKTSAEEVIDA